LNGAIDQGRSDYNDQATRGILVREVSLFDELMAGWPFRPIPDCPGRFVLRGQASHLSPEELLGVRLAAVEYQPASTPDRVVVTEFEGGALLTFIKPDGTHVHTLNTPEGLRRRLRRFGIEHE
jgi:hypothetical protein